LLLQMAVRHRRADQSPIAAKPFDQKGREGVAKIAKRVRRKARLAAIFDFFASFCGLFFANFAVKSCDRPLPLCRQHLLVQNLHHRIRINLGDCFEL
jgi:hypothetical protein